ncbi:MAG: histidine kinase dimerization/phospho-acceptor domain-containing protein [Candidatus Anammoxibacter sp.]
MQIYKTENVELDELNTTRELDGTFNHEMNNPLAAVLGNVELLLLDDSLDIETRTKLTSIRALSLKIKDVVREFAEINYHAPVKYNSRVDMADV